MTGLCVYASQSSVLVLDISSALTRVLVLPADVSLVTLRHLISLVVCRGRFCPPIQALARLHRPTGSHRRGRFAHR